MKPVLLAGEIFPSSDFSGGEANAASVNGAASFIEALGAVGIETKQLAAARCEVEFPRSVELLGDYSAVVLSDVGALSLLLTPEARSGWPGANRLECLRRWVEAGGGLMMAGGYSSFQGMDGLARFHGTPLEDCLPIECRPYSDGLEAPEGLTPVLTEPRHPVLSGLDETWPRVLGLNIVRMRAKDSQLLAKCDYRGEEHPLLAVREYGSGRSLAWTTDIGLHWLSRPFMDWPGYRTLAVNMIRWIAHLI